MSRIIAEEFQVEGIPVLTLSEDTSDRRPLVFFMHGFLAEKQQGLNLGYALAKAGFYFVSFDASMHGDRFDERPGKVWNGKGDLVYPLGSKLDAFFLMHEIVVQNAEDFEVLSARFSQREGVDAKRIGITGFSMGGFSTFYLAANQPAIRTAVSIAGIPAFAARWNDVTLEASTYEQWASVMQKAEEETVRRSAFMQTIDPWEKLTAFPPKPLLMIHGDRDIDSPKKYSVDLYRVLKPRYADHPERLRLSIHDEAGHQLTPVMIEEVRDWMVTHLLESNAGV
ncbi:MAG: prolyl oligopeptidase family serine peptidase [Anaerolineales bacterium]